MVVVIIVCLLYFRIDYDFFIIKVIDPTFYDFFYFSPKKIYIES